MYSNVFASRNFKSLLKNEAASLLTQKVISAFRIRGMEISQLPCLLVTGCQFISIGLPDRLTRTYATVPFYHCISLVNSKTNDLTSRQSRPSWFSQTVFLGGWNKSRKNRMLSQATYESAAAPGSHNAADPAELNVVCRSKPKLPNQTDSNAALLSYLIR